MYAFPKLFDYSWKYLVAALENHSVMCMLQTYPYSDQATTMMWPNLQWCWQHLCQDDNALSRYILNNSFNGFHFISFLDTITSPDLQCFLHPLFFHCEWFLAKKKSEIQTFIMWDMRFLGLQLQKLLSSRMWHCVVH